VISDDGGRERGNDGTTSDVRTDHKSTAIHSIRNSAGIKREQQPRKFGGNGDARDEDWVSSEQSSKQRKRCEKHAITGTGRPH